MNIRPAKNQDFEELYRIGKNTPEIKVSATEEFMDADEFKWSLTNPDGLFLIAEKKHQIIGFICANSKDAERPFEHRYACLVYLVVSPEFRRQGVAKALYIECETRLRTIGITNIFGWANAESEGEIIAFMKANGFAEGHRYLWMDKKIA